VPHAGVFVTGTDTRVGKPVVEIEENLPETAVMARFDRRLIAQA